MCPGCGYPLRFCCRTAGLQYCLKPTKAPAGHHTKIRPVIPHSQRFEAHALCRCESFKVWPQQEKQSSAQPCAVSSLIDSICGAACSSLRALLTAGCCALLYPGCHIQAGPEQRPRLHSTTAACRSSGEQDMPRGRMHIASASDLQQKEQLRAITCIYKQVPQGVSPA